MEKKKGENEVLFTVQDYRGKTTIFTKEKWEEKKSDHPELKRRTFLECVKRTIREPDEVWEDYQDRKHRRCYYKKYSATTYAKVVIWFFDNPCRVVTAYQIDYIKEIQYPKIKKVF